MFMDFFTAAEDVELIELVRVNSVLFDCSHFMHTDAVHKNYIWKQTAAKIGRTREYTENVTRNIEYYIQLLIKNTTLNMIFFIVIHGIVRHLTNDDTHRFLIIIIFILTAYIQIERIHILHYFVM